LHVETNAIPDDIEWPPLRFIEYLADVDSHDTEHHENNSAHEEDRDDQARPAHDRIFLDEKGSQHDPDTSYARPKRDEKTEDDREMQRPVGVRQDDLIGKHHPLVQIVSCLAGEALSMTGGD